MSEAAPKLHAVDAPAPAAQKPSAPGVTPPRRRGGSGRFLTDVLVDLGYTQRDRVEKAIEESRGAGTAPERVLLEQNVITSEQLSRAVAERYGLDHLDLNIFSVDMAAANLLSASAARRYGAVPVAFVDGNTVVVAMSDPANVLAVDDIALLTHLDVKPAVASEDDIASLISRIKIMAELDIAERRIPQDGRVSMTVEGRQVDVRVVTLPSVHGEGCVMRILDKRGISFELDKLGMQEHELTRFRKAFNRSYGAVLVTGPTGSGKSTSLYGALNELNTPEKNIITIEDPVEYQVAGVTQVQVNPKAGLTFAAGLRSMMRADPDIMMVGEIRDRETAQIAIEGALTGHLVLSTLHTNDAPSAITRLIEMQVEPFLVASSIDCVVAQRLARTLCANCKQRTIVPAQVLRDHGYKAQFDIEAYEPVGCVRCAGMGYKGRIGLYEVMTMSEDLRALTLQRASADQLGAVAVREGMRKLRDDGLDKVKAGLTSMAEVARVTGTG